VAGVSREKTTKIKAQVEEVKGVMEENIKQATARGENLDSLQTKVGMTHSLFISGDANMFVLI
jgi:copper chaperone CopZ